MRSSKRLLATALVAGVALFGAACESADTAGGDTGETGVTETGTTGETAPGTGTATTSPAP